MTILTKQQRAALKRIYLRTIEDDRKQHPAPTYRAFRRTVQIGRDYIMVAFAGMWLGIEADGYTHS